jgi:micrococcal nuclease
MKRANQKILLTLFVLLFLYVSPSSQAGDSQTAWVKRAVDGDTLLLTNGERVRLIGVDTPEVHESKKLYRDAERSGKDIKTIKALGRRASALTKKKVDKKQIRLEFDVNNAYINQRDKYGRILAYVYLTDGTFLNAEIVNPGYGFAYTRFPFKYMEEFRRYEREARERERGLWSRETRKSSVKTTNISGNISRKNSHISNLKHSFQTILADLLSNKFLLGILTAILIFLLREFITHARLGFRFRKRLVEDMKILLNNYYRHSQQLPSQIEKIEICLRTQKNGMVKAVEASPIWSNEYTLLNQLYGNSQYLNPVVFSKAVNFYDTIGRLSEVRKAYNENLQKIIQSKELPAPVLAFLKNCLVDLKHDYDELIVKGCDTLITLAQKHWFQKIDTAHCRNILKEISEKGKY